MRQHPLGQLIEGPELFATADLAFDFPEAEISGFALEERDFMQPLGIVQQGAECRMVRVGRVGVQVAWQHINFYGRYEFTKGPAPINLEIIVEEVSRGTLWVPISQGIAQ